jgi:hypothetical protein
MAHAIEFNGLPSVVAFSRKLNLPPKIHLLFYVALFPGYSICHPKFICFLSGLGNLCCIGFDAYYVKHVRISLLHNLRIKIKLSLVESGLVAETKVLKTRD